MKLTEKRAKEVLDFLVHKVNPNLSWHIIHWFDNNFALQIRFQESPIMEYTGILRRRDNNVVCLSYSSSCTCMLNTLMDDASQSSIIFYGHYIQNSPCEIIHKMTTLEQILIDMDLSANV